MRALLVIPLLVGCLDVPGFEGENGRDGGQQPAGQDGGGAGGDPGTEGEAEQAGGQGDDGDPQEGEAEPGDDGQPAGEGEGPGDDGGDGDAGDDGDDGTDGDDGDDGGDGGDGGDGEENTDELCSDGRDNDRDILTDCADPGCADTDPCDGDEGGEGGEDPPGPAVVEIAAFDTDGGTRGAQIDNVGDQVAVYIPSGNVQFWDLGNPIDGQPDRTRRVVDVLFRDFAMSPKLPLLVTASTNSDVQVWNLSEEGYPFVGYMVPERVGGGRGFMGRMRFNHAGTKVLITQRGSAVVIQVAGGIEETFREPDFGHGNTPVAEFVGRDEFVVVLEDQDLMRLRILPTIDDRGGGAPGTRVPANGPECNGITHISGARSVDLLAYRCGTGALHLRDPITWSEAKVFRGVIGGMDMGEISPDGRYLAGAEGDAVHVFDVQTGGRSTVDPGPRNRNYGPFLHWSDDGLLSVDRDRRVVVYRVADAPDRD